MSEAPADSTSGNERELYQSPYRWAILGACFLLNFFAHFAWLSIPVFLPNISSDLNVSLGAAQAIFSTVALSIAVIDIPGGFLNDRFPGRWVVGAGGLLVGSAGIVEWGIPSYAGLVASSVMIGIAIGLIYPGTVNMISEWFSSIQVGRAQGVNVVAFTVGGAVAQTLSSAVLPSIVGGWQNTLLIYGILALGATVVWVVFVRSPDSDEEPFTPDRLTAGDTGEARESSEGVEQSIPGMLRKLLSQRVTYHLIAVAFFINYMYFGIQDMIPVWSGRVPFSVPYFISTSTLYVAGAGALLLPAIAARLGLERVMYTVLMTGTVGVLVTAYAPSLPVFGLGILIAGLSGGGLYAFLFTLPATHPNVGAGATRTGTMSGLMLSLGHIGATLSPLLATGALGANAIGLSGIVLGLPLLGGIISILPIDIDVRAS